MVDKNRFEVEDISSRKNYTFVKTSKGVDMYNTSCGMGNRFDCSLGEKEYRRAGGESEKYTPDIHFKFLLDKSLRPNIYNIFFIGYVDENFQPIEEEG